MTSSASDLDGVLAPLAVVAAWLALAVAVLLPGTPPSGLVEALLPLTTVVSAAAVLLRAVRRPGSRLGWALLGGGLSGYGLGFVVLFHVSAGEGAVLGLNASDALSLLLYPLGYAGLVVLCRGAGGAVRRGALLDAAVVLLAASSVALGAVGLAVPGLLHGSPLHVLYALAYPVGGATLLVVCLSGLVAVRATWGIVWMTMGVALALMSTGDALYGLRSAAGTFAFGTWLDLLYAAGPAGIALAAWQREASGRLADRDDTGRWPAVLLPTGAGLVALALLALDHLRPLSTAAVVPALAAGVLSVLRTATALRQERLLDHTLREARVDEVTGLLSRRALLELLAQTDRSVLLVAELDGVDEVRDALGAPAADEIVRQLGRRVDGLMPDGSAGRLRGGGFGLLLPAGTDAEQAQAWAGALRDSLELPVEVDGQAMALRATTGGAARPDLPDPSEWLRRCDVALRFARSTEVRAALHAGAMDVDARQRLDRLSELRDALSAHPEQLVVHYQGKHRAGDGTLRSAEALIRWQHPQAGLLGPGAFLPMAEASGLLPLLTRHVLRRVLAEAAVVRLERPDWQVSVNVCAGDLLDEGFPARVVAELLRAGLPADVLRLEITETVVMTDPQRVLHGLRQLADAGIGLSLDDYGTGLASLAYLRDLPIDELKIDRSFVGNLLSSTDDSLIIASTVQLAHGLGLSVVAEGAEDLATVARLVELGCDEVQGFALSRPVRLAVLLHDARLDHSRLDHSRLDETRLPGGPLPEPRPPRAAEPARA